MSRITLLVVSGMLCSLTALAASPRTSAAGWVLARNAHFEVYSQAGPDAAKLALTRFEQIRSFFDRNSIVQAAPESQKKTPLRVIGFASKKEYDAFKLRATADAYYTGTPDRDYIVMPLSGANEFGIAAHEYAHFVLHSAGLKLPPWLNEGIAELFSTVTITNRQCELGGQIPARVDILRRQHWLPASQLLTAERNSPLRDTRGGAAIFYAESWAVVDMLTSSPDYAPHFRDLMGILNSENITSQQALAKAYNKSPDLVLADAQNWTSHARSARRTLPSLAPETVRMELNQVSQSEARAIVADLLFANGEWDRAEQIYQDLLHASPDNPEILASLGTVALRKANRQGAIEYWRKALDHGLTDAVLCYRYALLADEMELPSKEIERALQQAVTIRQDFDDARYKLALLESNAGEYDAAVNQLQSMSAPRPERAYGYWTALANALSELGKRNEADAAAKQALRFAKTSEERARAAELSWVANTDLAVRFAKSADGKPQLVTTRVPHGAADFNPFVEADDHIQVATGRLREVQCSEGKLTGFLVESKAGILSLAVPDPLHVLMRNGPSQFTCGPQTTGNVTVEYAASAKSNTGGLLRGMDFRAQ